MFPKLLAFSMKFMLPEIALPRMGTYTGIRQPNKPWFIPSQRVELTKTKCTRVSKPLVKPSKLVVHVDDQIAGPSHLCDDTLTDVNNNSTPKIRHKWIVDKETKKSKWYIGTVIDVVSGKDGDPQAVHEVLYKGEDSPYEVDGLQRDLDEGSLKKKLNNPWCIRLTISCSSCKFSAELVSFAESRAVIGLTGRYCNNTRMIQAPAQPKCKWESLFLTYLGVSCPGTPRDGPQGTYPKGLQLPQMMELKHMRAFDITSHPPQPHPHKLEI
ncbi:hypothetical protein DPMN_136850, partial [Dreissena polymorpha]